MLIILSVAVGGVSFVVWPIGVLQPMIFIFFVLSKMLLTSILGSLNVATRCFVESLFRGGIFVTYLFSVIIHRLV